MTAADIAFVLAVVSVVGIVASLLYGWFADAPDNHEGRDEEPTRWHDHQLCLIGGCDVVICRCDTRCPDHPEPSCDHGTAVCDDHRDLVCVDCAIDRADDAGHLDRGWVL